MSDLWRTTSTSAWRRALDAYVDVVARQGVARLAELDAWYRERLPAVVVARSPAHATREELVRLTEWKMARGVWRAPNLVLVRGNDAGAVVSATREALASVPHPRAPVARLAELAGVGPATASALLAAVHPDTYPFLDEIVAAQVPGLGKPGWTVPFYVKYADALRARAGQLGEAWTPAMVERALWAHAGGKAGVR